jgi:hypothetical protein
MRLSEQKAKNAEMFLDAKAPMTAKCIIRDAIAQAMGKFSYTYAVADATTVRIIEELATHGLVITDKPKTKTSTRRRQANTG